MRPLIGVTTYGRDERDSFSLPAPYVDALRRAGARCVLLPPGEREPASLLAVLDGLVLAGGGDIDPVRYGGGRHDSIYMVDEERDRLELSLAPVAVREGFPTLAICRGLHVVNVALGGTLHEHVPDVYGNDVEHRLPPRRPTRHAVRCEGGSILAGILDATEFEVASWHHQAVKDVAPGLRAIARAADGVIEALEKPDHPSLFAVQWHPELMAADDPRQQRLFDAFVDAARRGPNRPE